MSSLSRSILFLLSLATMLPPVFGAPPKRGRIVCSGEDCRAHDVPLGTTIELLDENTHTLEKDQRHEPKSSAPPTSAVDKLKGNPPTKLARASNRNVKRNAINQVQDLPTNLPSYYRGIDRSGAKASDKVVFVPKSSDPRLKGLKSGDIVWAVVEQEITASPSVATPVRATATSGQFKGSYFVGEATLDRELKRVLFSFSKLRLKEADTVYVVKATGLSPQGSVGLEGEYHSQTGKFFIAELASAAAAGYLDSTINRNQTTLGTYVQEPSIGNSGKTAAVTALSKTAERAADAARNAPEYTTVKGYQEIQIIVQEDPVDNGY